MRAKRAVAIALTGLMLFEASPVPQISQALTIQNAAAVRQLMSTLTASTAYADTSENAGGGTLQVDTAASTEASGADAADSSAATGSGASADSVSNADVTADADAPATTSDAATADAPAPADAITATNQPAAQTATDAAVEDAAQDLAQLAGRDFQGQVTKTINGKTYILIGNEQQLRAIGSGKKVTRPVWEITQEYRKTGSIKGGWAMSRAPKPRFTRVTRTFPRPPNWTRARARNRMSWVSALRVTLANAT